MARFAAAVGGSSRQADRMIGRKIRKRGRTEERESPEERKGGREENPEKRKGGREEKPEERKGARREFWKDGGEEERIANFRMIERAERRIAVIRGSALLEVTIVSPLLNDAVASPLRVVGIHR
jgi:phage tail tape-measure protein